MDFLRHSVDVPAGIVLRKQALSGKSEPLNDDDDDDDDTI